MILFLVLVYCGALFALIKIKLLKPTLLVKLSPVAWTLLLFIGLFVPMMFWAPSGRMIISQRITRMTPQVGGQIVKVHVRPNQRVKKGDPLLTVDPTQYQYKVAGLRAHLAAAKQGVLELKATLDAANAAVAAANAQREEAKSSLEASTSAVAQAEDQREGLKASFDAASSAVVKARASRDLAATAFEIAQTINKSDVGAISKLRYTQAQQDIAEAEAAVSEAIASQTNAQIAYEKTSLAAIQIAQANEQKARIAYENHVPATIAQAEANAEKARLAYESEIDGVNTTVAQIESQLAIAEYDLQQTVMTAPADGFVTDLQLTEGSAIALFAGSAMINFIAENEPRQIIASIQEKNLRYVKPGQPAEVVLPLYPGETLSGKVDEVVWVTGEGQVLPQQAIPAVASRVQTGGQFAVKVQLDPQWSDRQQPIGAGGVVAIYTDHGKPTHIIRKVMMRMTAWTNYVFQLPGQ